MSVTRIYQVRLTGREITMIVAALAIAAPVLGPEFRRLSLRLLRRVSK